MQGWHRRCGQIPTSRKGREKWGTRLSHLLNFRWRYGLTVNGAGLEEATLQVFGSAAEVVPSLKVLLPFAGL
jgi:hypothetical protein